MTGLSDLLGFHRAPARALLVLFVLTHLLLAISAGEAIQRPLQFVVLAVIVVSAVVAMSGRADPIDLPRTVVAIASVAVGTAVGSTQLTSADPPGFAAWYLGAGSFVLFALAIRGRIAAAWTGALIVFAITLVWSVLISGDLLPGVNLYYGQLASLFAGTFFALILRGTARRIHRFQRIEGERAARERARQVGDEERSRQVTRLRDLVAAPLAQIASGRSSASDRQEFRLLEAALRDGIRGRSLQREPLVSAIRAARQRGCQVVVLDDTDETREAAIDEDAATWAATRLSELVDATVTIRLTVASPGRALSVSTDDGVAASLSLSS